MCLEGLFGGGDEGLRSVVGSVVKSAVANMRPDPAQQQGKLVADAASTATQERLARRRRLRVHSLLATGGAGDTRDIVTGQPTALAGKQTLGA